MEVNKNVNVQVTLMNITKNAFVIATAGVILVALVALMILLFGGAKFIVSSYKEVPSNESWLQYILFGVLLYVYSVHQAKLGLKQVALDARVRYMLIGVFASLLLLWVLLTIAGNPVHMRVSLFTGFVGLVVKDIALTTICAYITHRVFLFFKQI